MRTLASTPIAVPVCADAALPGLERALDAGELGQELREGWDDADGPPPDPATGHLFYVRYKPGTSLLAGFRYRRAGAAPSGDGEEQLPLDAEGLPSDDIVGYARLLPRARFAEALSTARAVAAKRSGARLIGRPAAGLLLHLFPFDRALVGLRTLARRGPLKRWATTRLPWSEPAGRVSGSASTVHLLRYKPERRAVFAADLVWESAARDRRERHPVVLKSYAPGEGARAFGVMQRLAEADSGHLKLARPLAWSSEERILVQSRIDGSPLFAPPESGITTRELHALLARRSRSAGEALALLQRVAPPDTLPPPPGGAAWADATLETCERLGPLLERLGAGGAAVRSRELSRRLTGHRAGPTPYTLIHGDFYHHQILIDARRVGIVDFDEAACDDPRVDAGNFLAHLDLEQIRGADDVDDARAAADSGCDGRVGLHAELLADAFLAGYAAAGGPTADVAWFRAAALARLALVPFRNLRPGWPERAETLLQRALEVVS